MDVTGESTDIWFADVVLRGRRYPLTIGSLWYNDERFDESRVHLEAGDVTITGPGIYAGPFTFEMAICGLQEGEPGTAPCRLHFGLSGSGNYEMVVADWPGERLGIPRSTYTFSDDLKLDYVVDETVPEPAGVVLVLSGGVFLVLVRRFHRRF
jgi:hypothetical protein